ncbi:hypothetical protein FEM48_Zijuj05G0164900 [Ziziphus jujuba var. spinosa]|uniref:Uncharacterized protein n=1 Tax=Ziziphus jujuba var. spinosa TaxID=714518 RepID=A0A978VFW4_ZIZJJ|nr:hypothetical protein FEM48_Zijuj05G0164900 [Ziziphus jujuba var. spinosa]
MRKVKARPKIGWQLGIKYNDGYCEAARSDAGPAVVVSYFISGVAALLSILCYTEFSVELPVAGGSFAYLRVELGDFAAYNATGNILFEYMIASASVARSWASYFATLCKSPT